MGDPADGQGGRRTAADDGPTDHPHGPRAASGGELPDDGPGDEAPAVVAELRGIELTYPGPPPVAAVRGCDLQIRAGEYVAITGASGSGKSSLLNIIGLLDQPTAGAYRLNGLDVAQLSDGQRTAARARAIGFVFQSFHLIGQRTATENVALGMLYAQVRRPERLRRARQTLAQVGLAARAEAVPPQLSGGEQQRVAIARALASQPSLLLCDEPTGNLDSAATATVLDLLARLHDDGVTIVMITHDPAVARRAERVLVMDDGRLGETADTAPTVAAPTAAPAAAPVPRRAAARTPKIGPILAPAAASGRRRP
ncbi:MAG: ABC transporter ATP-binding protein [Propionibacteriaceae bacterium]|jgi:putative ABC transport system ATP-binding protein|nr:ABC transporter ATP-binding protein [Propionibacteriaceae bacterium]